MPVSNADRAFFARIGEYKKQSHRDATAAHRALPLRDRLRISEELSARFAGKRVRGSFDDGPLAFYERARNLGLFEP